MGYKLYFAKVSKKLEQQVRPDDLCWSSWPDITGRLVKELTTYIIEYLGI